MFPHSRSMNDPDEVEEERRLCYVGITRAKERLSLSWALHRRIHGYGVGEPSRFLREMPENQLLPLNAGRVQEPSMPARAVGRYEPEEESWPIRVGARVRHARFGEGLVVGVERDGSDTIVTVGFASVGRKRLSMQYAQLENCSDQPPGRRARRAAGAAGADRRRASSGCASSSTASWPTSTSSARSTPAPSSRRPTRAARQRDARRREPARASARTRRWPTRPSAAARSSGCRRSSRRGAT